MIIRRRGMELNLTEVRGQLRRSFGHDLLSSGNRLVQHARGRGIWLPDPAVLRLFSGLRVCYANAVNKACPYYNEHRSEEDPQWSELASRGLIRESAGRIWLTELGAYLARTQPMPALQELHRTRFVETYEIADEIRRDPDLVTVVAAIDAGIENPFDGVCQSPGWVAARLWDSVADEATPDDLLEWLTKWRLLGSPNVVPSSVWSPERTEQFVSAALAAIEANLPEHGWQLLRGEITSWDQSTAARVPPVPLTSLDRLEWLERLQYTHDRIGEDSSILDLVSIMLQQITNVDFTGVPYADADRLFELALERPAALRAIASWCSSFPVLLADLVLNPSLCALACALIGERLDGWANPMSFEVADSSTQDRQNAFSDAVTVLTFQYESDRLPAADVASLFIWALREHGTHFAVRRGAVLSRLRQMVQEMAPERIQAIVADLQGSPEFILATPAYLAALEILSASAITNAGDADLFLNGYVDALQRANFGLSVRHVSEGAAEILMRLAVSTPGSAMLDPPADLFALTPSDDPAASYAEEGRRARAVRAHIRVLCRALGRLEGRVYSTVLDGLVHTIRYGARSNGNGGLVGAFAARYEDFPGADNDRPIAQDLASALTLAKDEDRARVLEAVVGIDEPYTLAQLYTLVRPELRPQLATRLSRLSPTEAAPIFSYTEIQLRIDALMNAGLGAQAQLFVDAERDVRTLGRVPQRERERFTNGLRLALLREDWQMVYSSRVPDDVKGLDIQIAEENRAFYCGVANLLDPNGSAELSEQIFQNLAWSHPHIPAYMHNLLVARTRELYRDDLFAILPEERREDARVALVDAKRALAAPSVSNVDRDRLDGFRGLLLLGLRETDEAVELLGPRLVATENPYLAAIVAVAQKRLGLGVQASHTLAAAHERFGAVDILTAAQAVVGNDVRIVVRPEPEQFDNRLRAIADAVRDFLDLDPNQQARALNETHTLSDLVIDVVRDACVDLEEIIPGFPGTWNEPEYNMVLHKLVRGRVSTLKWSVAEESPGGYADSGARGRRDIVITRGTPTYVVIEGMVVDRSVRAAWTRGTLSQHFVKLFGYAPCDVFVHVTYAEIADREGIIDLLQVAARDDVPDDVEYIEAIPLPNRGSSPPGFVVKYRRGSQGVSVAFLVLDMDQSRMANAAATAGRFNPRSAVQSKKTPENPSATKKARRRPA